MGQKTNPNILRLGVSKNYNFKYIEKKSTEFALYNFKNLEIKNFVYQFFKNNNLKVSICKINYSSNDNLHISISYYALPKKNAIVNEIDEESTSTILLNKKLPNGEPVPYDFYKLISSIKLLNKTRIAASTQKKFLVRKQIKKLYIKKLRHLKQEYCAVGSNSVESGFEKTNFLTDFLESLYKFLNKNLKVYLTVKQLNKKIKKKINRKNIKIIKKQLVKLNRYKKNEFFKEGVNTLFICSQHLEPASLLADFIANQLQKTKRHNFFLKFVKKALMLFKRNKNLKLKGIKIKITGKLNRSHRARHRTVKIDKILPVLSMQSNIDYAEKVAFTPAGTVGVKVWAFCKQ